MASKTTGADAVQKRLRKMGKEAAQAAVRALYLAGQQIELDAEKSITDGSVSGKGHIPSLPGQPPNADTRDLDMKIDTIVVTQDPPTVHVEAYSGHAAFMEFGTSRVAERPFMRPAVEKNRSKIAQGIAVQVSRNSR